MKPVEWGYGAFGDIELTRTSATIPASILEFLSQSNRSVAAVGVGKALTLRPGSTR